MGMMTRFVKIWKADLHGLMDQFEDRSLVLKQSLRDMEEELEKKELRLRQMRSTKEQYSQEQDSIADERQRLEQDLEVALENDKDDIARMLIKKLKPVEGHQQALARRIETICRDIDQLAAIIEEQRGQYRKFALQVKDYMHQQEKREWDEVVSSHFPGAGSDLSPEEIELELIRRKKSSKRGDG